MFAVKICIYTDDDFGYKEPEFNIGYDEEKTFYFNTRGETVDALIRSFHNLKKSLRPCGREYIKRWVDSTDNRIELIAKKIRTFVIGKDFGNQSILYKLFEVKKVEMNNGSYYYDSLPVDIDFSWYEAETIKWDALIEFPDIEG